MMNQKTAKALEASIVKWEKNARARSPNSYLLGPSNCALCGIYYGRGCVGCPVRERTGMVQCQGSPCDEAEDAASRWEWSGNPKAGIQARRLAKEEVAFLKSLRAACQT